MLINAKIIVILVKTLIKFCVTIYLLSLFSKLTYIRG